MNINNKLNITAECAEKLNKATKLAGSNYKANVPCLFTVLYTVSIIKTILAWLALQPVL